MKNDLHQMDDDGYPIGYKAAVAEQLRREDAQNVNTKSPEQIAREWLDNRMGQSCRPVGDYSALLTTLQWFVRDCWPKESQKDGRHCEHCGTKIIDNCPVCGAPQCCPKCCDETTKELLQPATPERNDMTKEQMRIAIAEHEGWRSDQHYNSPIHWHKGFYEMAVESELPDYPNDLNAVAEIVRGLPVEQRGTFGDFLRVIHNRYLPSISYGYDAWVSASRTAEEMCQALIRLWGIKEEA